MRGLCETRETGKKQRVSIEITPANSFSWIDFSNVMHALGVDISRSRKITQNADGATVTFQPEPYGNSGLLKALTSSKEVANHFIASFFDYEPSPINLKSEK